MSTKHPIFAFWKVPAVVGAATIAGCFVPISKWTDVSQELAIFFGLMAAALPQAMALTAQVQGPPSIRENDARELADRLENQQLYWSSLLVLCGIAILFLVAAKMIVGDPNFVDLVILPFSVLELKGISGPDVRLGPILSSVLSATITLLVIHMFRLGAGIISLQRLRSRSLIDGARESEKLKAPSEPAVPFRPDPGFGQVIKSPSRRSAASK